jgi:hypothetical protein
VADALLAAIAFWIYFRTRERPSQA